MDNKYIREVTSAMHEFMTGHGFTADHDNSLFKNDSKVYKIAYDEQKKTFSIAVASIVDNEEGESKNLSSWYFDEENHGANDVKCVADDFVNVVAKDNGIKLVASFDNSYKEIELPKKAEEGAEPNIEAFTQKFLAVFPQYKDNYKEMLAKYGSFLYVEFYKNYGIQKMRELMADEGKNKKQLQKYFKMLGEMHYEGDSNVGDVICTVIIAGSFYDDVAAFNAAADKYLEDFPFLKSAARAAVMQFKGNKKLRNALGI